MPHSALTHRFHWKLRFRSSEDSRNIWFRLVDLNIDGAVADVRRIDFEQQGKKGHTGKALAHPVGFEQTGGRRHTLRVSDLDSRVAEKENRAFDDVEVF
jgi:hypothetical protein